MTAAENIAAGSLRLPRAPVTALNQLPALDIS
jgi:hypothetical protein